MLIQNERGMLSLARKEGRLEGIDEGRKQGIDEGRKQGIDEGRKQLLRAVCDICELLSIPLSSERLAHLESLDLTNLAALRERIKTTKTW